MPEALNAGRPLRGWAPVPPDAVLWWSLGGLGTFVDVMRLLDLGSVLGGLRRLSMRMPAVLVLMMALGLASTAQAGPAPVKPTPVKPNPIKPAAQPTTAKASSRCPSAPATRAYSKAASRSKPVRSGPRGRPSPSSIARRKCRSAPAR